MASLVPRPNSRYWIQYKLPGEKRQTLRLPVPLRRREAEVIASHVENLIQAKRTATPAPPATMDWVVSVDDELRKRLDAKGLTTPRGATNIGELWEWVATELARKKREQSTIRNCRCAANDLKTFFGADRSISTLTKSDAADFKAWIEARRKRPLAESTISRRCRRAQQFFEVAVSERWIVRNPFEEFGEWDESNEERDLYIPAEQVQELMRKTNPEFAALLAAVRFGGLRCASEIHPLVWSWVDADASILRVLAPKTKRYPNGKSRKLPICAELGEAFQDHFDTADASPLVFPNYQVTRTAIANTLERLCRRIGIAMWTKPFVNMRASFENDLWEAGHSVPDVAAWLGHSPRVAMKHYSRFVKERTTRKAAGMLRLPDWRSGREAKGEAQETPGTSNPGGRARAHPGK